METNNLIFGAYGALIAVALITVALYLVYLAKRWKGKKSLKDPFFETAIGILGIALSTLVIRVWFQGWKAGEILGFKTQWMLNHPTVIWIILLPCACYVWHIRTITWRQFGQKVWIFSAVAGGVSFLLTYWFATRHEWLATFLSWLL